MKTYLPRTALGATLAAFVSTGCSGAPDVAGQSAPSAASGGISVSVGSGANAASASGGDASSTSSGPLPMPCTNAKGGALTPGSWENVTPPAVLEKGSEGGTIAFVVDPVNTAIVYVGTSHQGIFKTTNCGADWTHINTGENGAMLDQGLEGTFAIDPTHPEVIYTDGRIGGPGGVFKSTNGGVDWQQINPPEIAQVFENGGEVESIAIDPTMPSHLVVTPHFKCVAPHPLNCLVESTDGGASWTVIDPVGAPDRSMILGELSGQVILDFNTWLWAEPFGGLWRTTDRGAHWDHVWAGYGVYPYVERGSDGNYYAPGATDGVLRSPDAIHWTAIVGSHHAEGMSLSSTEIYVSDIYTVNQYSSAAIANAGLWTKLPTLPPPASGGGWMLRYDAHHHILYSSGFGVGFYRLVTP